MQFAAAAQLLWYVLSFLKVEGFKGEKNRTFVQIKSTKTKCFIIFILHCTYMITMGKNIQD